MNFDKESQSRIFFLCVWWGGGGGGLGRVQLSCGHVEIDRMIIHDDIPDQRFFLVGRERRGVGREFRAIILKCDILYHPYSFKSSSRFSG